MSQIMEEGPLREAAILTRAVENVFRKLIRLLLGSISLVKMQEILRFAFIGEAEATLTKDNPDKKVSLTKLALMTGLDTRTLTKILKERTKSPPLDQKKQFLKDLTPEASVLDYWSYSSKYTDEDSLRPLTLRLRGDSPSFESLVRETIATRGITTSSILLRLLESKSINFDEETQQVSIIDKKFITLGKETGEATIDIALAAVSYLVGTIVHNYEVGDHSKSAFFQRSYWTHRLDKRNIAQFREITKEYLAKSEESAILQLSEFEEDQISENQITAGISIFYFEDESTT